MNLCDATVMEVLCEPYKINQKWLVRVLAEDDCPIAFEDTIVKDTKEEILQVRRGFVYLK